ncbi:MAG: ferrous iron transport protein A [Bacteriovoracaceae bacterium]|jgi:Fe2+ transport system protein FeoA|nr:ferrous iron transport protein A [Bacteriovoracaceae bacterium]
MEKCLIEAQIGVESTISSVVSYPGEEDFALRLAHLGFIQGQKITILKVAPIFGEPILISLRGGQLALTKKEASCIMVERKQ